VQKAKAVEGNRILNLEQHPKMRLIQIIMGAPHRGEADAISVSTTEAKGQVRDGLLRLRSVCRQNCDALISAPHASAPTSELSTQYLQSPPEA
jgi:hypothetical protein